MMAKRLAAQISYFQRKLLVPSDPFSHFQIYSCLHENVYNPESPHTRSAHIASLFRRLSLCSKVSWSKKSLCSKVSSKKCIEAH